MLETEVFQDTLHSEAGTKILLIGLDGATLDLLLPWAEEGFLPTVSRFLDGGSWGPLRSTIPPVSPVAWSSFLTGTNPGNHGVFGFLGRKPGTNDWFPVSTRERSGMPFLTWCGLHGLQAGVCNMPMTYPPEVIPNGYVVSGLGVPDADVSFTYPPELQRDLLSRFDRNQLIERNVGHFDNKTYAEYLLRTVDDTLAVIHHLLRLYPRTNLFCGVFIASDRAQHFYWQQMLDPSAPSAYRGLIRKVYQRLDRALASLLTKHPEYTVVVMSDHGAGPYKRLVDLNQWLAKHGWLEWRGSPQREYPRIQGWRGWYENLAPRVPDSLRYRLKKIIPSALMSRFRTHASRQTLAVDWSQTLAYSLGVTGGIYLNLLGRESEGRITPGTSAETLLDEIAAALHTLKDPDSDAHVVERVDRASALYKGPAAHLAPDLVVTWKPGYYGLSRTTACREIFRPPLHWPGTGIVHSAEHRPEGILLAMGPGISKGVRIKDASIIDLAPTLLHLLRLPIPTWMEGKVLNQVIDTRQVHWPISREESRTQPNRPENQPYSEDEREQLLEHLRHLGYLG